MVRIPQVELSKYFFLFMLVFMVLSAIVAISYDKGYDNAKQKYEPQIIELRGKIKIADDEAKRIQIKQEQDNEQLRIEHQKTVDGIDRYYSDRLRQQSGLHPNQASGITQCDCGHDEGSGESGVVAESTETISRCPIEVEQACVLDAARLLSWQEWARMQGFQIKN